jgi:hypothetical protein
MNPTPFITLRPMDEPPGAPGSTSPQVGGLMMTTMRPTMRPCSGTSHPAADDPPGAPVSVSPQVGGFMIWRCGVHDDGTGSIGVREPQMNRNTALRLLGSRLSSPRTPARHTDGRITGPSSPDIIRTILADHQTDGSGRSRTRGRVNAQLRPFIIRVMRQVMRQVMRPGPGSQIGPVAAADGAPESTSSQLRGLIISVPGVHDCRTSPSIQSVDPLSLLSFGANDLALLHLLPHTGPASRPTGEGLRSRLRRDRRRHTAWSQCERPDDITSTGFQLRLDSHVLPSLPNRTRRNNGEPGGPRVQEAPGTPITLTMRVHDRGSKMDNQHG